jgi:hypothetical protein
MTVMVGAGVGGGRVGIHDIKGVGSAVGASVGGSVSGRAETELGLMVGLAVMPVAGSTTTEVASVGGGEASAVGEAVSVSSTAALGGTDVAITTWLGAAVGTSVAVSVIAVTAAAVGSRVRVVAPSLVGDAVTVTFSAPLLLAVGSAVAEVSPGQRTAFERCVSGRLWLVRQQTSRTHTFNQRLSSQRSCLAVGDPEGLLGCLFL